MKKHLVIITSHSSLTVIQALILQLLVHNYIDQSSLDIVQTTEVLI